jgi:hypothetical protein
MLRCNQPWAMPEASSVATKSVAPMCPSNAAKMVPARPTHRWAAAYKSRRKGICHKLASEDTTNALAISTNNGRSRRFARLVLHCRITRSWVCSGTSARMIAMSTTIAA